MRTSSPATPASAIVGTDGSSGERCVLKTASGRARPASIAGSAAVTLATSTCTSSTLIALTVWPEPR